MRITDELLARRRGRRENRILVTGATGFLGSHVVAELLAKGYPVTVLVRSRRGLSARQRMDRLLDWLGTDESDRSRLDVIEGSMERTNLGMAPQEYASLGDRVHEIVHCASDTSFSEKKRSAIERANIGGVQNVFDLAGNGACCFFHYLSTAYVAGGRSGVCREEAVEGQTFANAYEETKHRAEAIVSERCAREGIRLSIYRPSIVYGNWKTGRSLGFKAVYYPVRVLLFLKDLYEADIRERGGRMAREMGVWETEDGSLCLPIRVEVAQNGGVNLIPVDYFTEAFMAIMEGCLDGGIFHIVNERLKRVEDLIDYIKRLFRIQGIQSCQAGAFDGRPRNALEILFDNYTGIYAPYMRDTRTFDDQKARAILSRKGLSCPDFDFGAFSRCMSYAVECGWGARVFEEKTGVTIMGQVACQQEKGGVKR